MARLEELVRDHPNTPRYQASLAESLLRFGQARLAEHDFVGARADWRRAIALFKSAPILNGERVFFYAGCHAALSSLARQPGTEMSDSEGNAEADQAMALLRRAAKMGYRNTVLYRNESALDPLRDRADFRLLMMDLTFPADPFPSGR